MSNWMKFGLLAFLFLLISAIPLAMMQPDAGSIEGLVADEMGPVAGATVEVHQQVTGVFLHAESDMVGYYRVENLRAGHYSLWVEAGNHDSVWIAQVMVDRGKVARQDVFIHRTHLGIPTED